MDIVLAQDPLDGRNKGSCRVNAIEAHSTPEHSFFISRLNRPSCSVQSLPAHQPACPSTLVLPILYCKAFPVASVVASWCHLGPRLYEVLKPQLLRRIPLNFWPSLKPQKANNIALSVALEPIRRLALQQHRRLLLPPVGYSVILGILPHSQSQPVAYSETQEALHSNLSLPVRVCFRG